MLIVDVCFPSSIRGEMREKDNRKVKVFAPSGYYADDPEKIKEEKINDK
jgi:hypothetical protein